MEQLNSRAVEKGFTIDDHLQMYIMSYSTAVYCSTDLLFFRKGNYAVHV